MSVKEIFENIEYGPAPESAAAASAWLDDHGRKFGLFINNQWVLPESAEFYPSLDPATGNKLADTVQAADDNVDLPGTCLDRLLDLGHALCDGGLTGGEAGGDGGYRYLCPLERLYGISHPPGIHANGANRDILIREA